MSDTTDLLKPVSPVFESLIYYFVFNLSFGILTRGSVPCYLASLMHLHLSKSSFSQIFQWSHAAHSRPFQSCFQTRFVFEPKAMQSYDHFLNCANFQAFFWKLFSAVGSVGASARVVFPFAVAKVLLFAELAKYFTGKIQTNFHRFSHTAGTQPLTPKTFSHAKTTMKKQCASRPATHTLYNIRNEIFRYFFSVPLFGSSLM